MSSLSDHVAFFLGTHGPSLTLETACSSSLVALAMAVAALRKGDCDYAIVTCANIPQDKDFHLSLVRFWSFRSAWNGSLRCISAINFTSNKPNRPYSKPAAC